MTELEKMKRAKMYIEQLANGIDPISGNELPDDTLLNNVRLSRCFFYTAEILRQVIDNGGVGDVVKKQFEITEEQKRMIPLSDTPILITNVCNNISSVVDLAVFSKLQPVKVNNWLMKLGFLKDIEMDNGTRKTIRKTITDTSKLIGISQEERIAPNGSSYTANLYNKEAQQFIIDHLDEILAIPDEKNNTQQ